MNNFTTELLNEKRAREIWDTSKQINLAHPYLKQKYIDIYYDCSIISPVKQLNNDIILPIYNSHGSIHNLQFIKTNGDKQFLYDDCIDGLFIPVTDVTPPDDRYHQQVIICESWETGCTLANKYPHANVIAAISANNLMHIALLANGAWDDCTLIIAADDNRLIPGNPGITKAKEAAHISGALLALPQWPLDAPMSLTNFNDLLVWGQSL